MGTKHVSIDFSLRDLANTLHLTLSDVAFTLCAFDLLEKRRRDPDSTELVIIITEEDIEALAQARLARGKGLDAALDLCYILL